jgi:uncharacterized damage-inducible protein DinB
MSLLEILRQEAEGTYAVTEKLFRRVEPASLSWKPATGENWMTVGQLLMHCTNSCGMAFKGMLTGDWGMPEGVKMEDLKPEEMLPPAEKLPTVESVEQAIQLLHADRELTLKLLAEADERRLLTECFPAPWGGPPVTLLQHLWHMVGHLEQHKGQLFYYLKLMGQKVGTADLYWM